MFTFFAAQPGGEPSYLPLPVGPQGIEMLSKTLTDKLEDYNSSHSIMDLVLFEQAMEHIVRICRIISAPGGNAMLIGVGGSGKQSLSKLSASICGYDIRQLSVTSKFTVMDLKENLKDYYRAGKGCYSFLARSLLRHWSSHLAAGVKGTGLVFLLTDSQISALFC